MGIVARCALHSFAVGCCSLARIGGVVPGSVLLYISEMGHDIPPQVWPAVVSAVLTHTAR